MTDLVEFLRARIDEDEAVAHDAAGPEVFDWRIGAYFGDLRVQDTDSFSDQLLINPARVLAECEAKRRIVRGIQAVIGKPVFAVSEDCGEPDLDFRCILRLLALPYADHPDYREEWKP